MRPGRTFAFGLLCLTSGLLILAACSNGGGLPVTDSRTATGTSTTTVSAPANSTALHSTSATSTATWANSTGTTYSPPASSVTFRDGQAQGLMTGWGWVTLGRQDTVYSPTCDGIPITSGSVCQMRTSWMNRDELCVSGSIPALPPSPLPSDYDANWGIQLGVSATADEPSNSLGVDFNSLTFTFSGSPAVALRAVVHLAGDPATRTYCYDRINSREELPLSQFNTACADSSGEWLGANAARIDWIALRVPATSSTVAVALCLQQIDLGARVAKVTATRTTVNTATISTKTATNTATASATSATSTSTATVSITQAGANKVTFATGQARGAMTGWGWVALGSEDTLTSPSCGGDPITNARPCMTVTTWASDEALCISGAIPALPASPVQSDYDANWGMMVGVNATDDEPTGAVGKALSSITLTFSGTPVSGLSAIVHLKGDPAGTMYCYEGIKSGQPIDVTKFNTFCWDGRGKSLSVSDSAKIDRIGLRVSSAPSAITVSNLCLSGIEFSPLGGTTTATKTAVVTGTGTPTAKSALVFTPSTFDLGNVRVGATKAGQFLLHNSGAGAATALAVSVSGTDFAVDAASTTCKISLDAGATCVVGYILAPKTAGDKTGQIAATATGSSAVAIVTARAPAPAALVITPTAASLTSDLGTDSAAFTFTVANSGGTATGNLSATISGTGKDSFKTTVSTCTSLEPRSYCTVSVVFNATTTGTKTARLTVTDSVVSASSDLTGMATVPRTPQP